MQIKDICGRLVNKNYISYSIDWDKKTRSKFQTEVKNFLRPFWVNHVVYEEMPVAGSKMTIDLFNHTRRIAVEVDGQQHDNYSEFFHGSRSNYLQQIKRDITKNKFCDINNIQLIRILPEDLKKLSRTFILEKFQIDIL